jgi:acetyltransferase
MNSDLTSLFYPKSIAVVGVSSDPRKLSSIFFTNLIDAGYKGELFPVNPKYENLFGYQCYKSVSSIPNEVEQVAILIPSQFVLDVVKDCAEKNVKSIMIISAGFGESGPEGEALEQEVVKVAKEAGIRILGPNIIGVVNTAYKLNSSWMQLFPKEGNISFLSQSGAFCTAILDISLRRNLGFYNFCSVGNKADINELDLINHWYQDDKVKVIGAYLEEIAHGYDLHKFLATTDLIKPIILLKPGKSEEAVKAIASHTGSLAGTSEIIDALVSQTNLVYSESSNELLDDLMSFSWSKQVKGNKVLVITNAGGPGIMATDAIIGNGLKMAALSDATKEELKKILPAAASVNNPIDVLGDASADRYQQASDIVLKDENVDAVMFILTPQYITEIEDTAKTIIRLKRFSSKPLFAVFLGQKYVDIGIERLFDAHVPVFNEIEFTAKAIADLFGFYQALNNRDLETNNRIFSEFESLINKGLYNQEIEHLASIGENVSVPDTLAFKMAKESGLDMPAQELCENFEQAKLFAGAYYPVVLKIPNEFLAHKTEEKALKVNIKDETELEAAFKELKDTLDRIGQGGKPLLIQEMVKAEQEFFIGSNRDGDSTVYSGGKSGFGHLLVYGQGGIYTEIFKDLAHTLVPTSKAILENDLSKTKIDKILQGARGLEPLARDRIVDSLLAVQKLVALYPKIVSLDINPLLITKDRAVAVDIKIYLKQ